jgi:hypothetical protein
MREIIFAADGIHHDRKHKGQSLRPNSNSHTYNLTFSNVACLPSSLWISVRGATNEL